MRKKRSGFNLVEALLSFALFLLVLSLIVQGVTQLSRVSKYFDAKSQVFAQATSLLARLSTDLREANIVSSPALGDPATYALLDLKKIEPSQWPSYYPATPPTPWEPRDPALQEQVLYTLAGDQLQCQTIAATSQLETVATGVQGFTVKRVRELCIEVRVSFLVNERLTVFTRLVWLPQAAERIHP
jgi:type II secretory pathway component PulJ